MTFTWNKVDGCLKICQVIICSFENLPRENLSHFIHLLFLYWWMKGVGGQKIDHF